MLSEGSSVKESPEDKQPSGPCIKGKCQDFMVGHSGTLHWGGGNYRGGVPATEGVPARGVPAPGRGICPGTPPFPFEQNDRQL